MRGDEDRSRHHHRVRPLWVIRSHLIHDGPSLRGRQFLTPCHRLRCRPSRTESPCLLGLSSPTAGSRGGRRRKAHIPASERLTRPAWHSSPCPSAAWLGVVRAAPCEDKSTDTGASPLHDRGARDTPISIGRPRRRWFASTGDVRPWCRRPQQFTMAVWPSHASSSWGGPGGRSVWMLGSPSSHALGG